MVAIFFDLNVLNEKPLQPLPEFETDNFVIDCNNNFSQIK